MILATVESGERRAPSARFRSVCFPLLSGAGEAAGEGGEAGSAVCCTVSPRLDLLGAK